MRSLRSIQRSRTVVLSVIVTKYGLPVRERQTSVIGRYGDFLRECDRQRQGHPKDSCTEQRDRVRLSGCGQCCCCQGSTTDRGVRPMQHLSEGYDVADGTLNNNNTFTWSGPSGVLGCTGQRPVAPAAGWCMPSTQCDGCHAVPLNLLNRQGVKTSAEEKDYDSGFERVAFCNTRIRLP
jgi:hypothetical protein